MAGQRTAARERLSLAHRDGARANRGRRRSAARIDRGWHRRHRRGLDTCAAAPRRKSARARREQPHERPRARLREGADFEGAAVHGRTSDRSGDVARHRAQHHHAQDRRTRYRGQRRPGRSCINGVVDFTIRNPFWIAKRCCAAVKSRIQRRFSGASMSVVPPTAARAANLAAGIEITGRITPEYAEILTPEALAFVAKLHRKFEGRRQELLARRVARQKEFDAGKLPDFLADTKSIREAEWKIADQPRDMLDRRVEITGPTDRKMVINALNSGASTFMADFEDANCPTWSNMIEGQINLRDAIRRTIAFEQGGKQYRLNDKVAVLIPRPRGWHLEEKHVRIDGKPVSGAIFDFALLFFHNAKELLARSSGPYFYLPKMESHLEARLWNDIFRLAQDELGA